MSETEAPAPVGSDALFDSLDLAVTRRDFKACCPLQQQFIIEAEKGYFTYGIEVEDDGRASVWARGARDTANLFSMEVEEFGEQDEDTDEATYVPVIPESNA